MKSFGTAIFLLLSAFNVHSYRIIKDSCPVCPPCAIRPPQYSHKETYFEDFRKMSVVKEPQESTNFKTVDLGKLRHLPVKSLHQQIGDIVVKTTTKRVPSTIPTATPFAPTLIPMKEEEILTTVTETTVVEGTTTRTTVPYVISSSTPTPEEFGREGNSTEKKSKDIDSAENVANATTLSDLRLSNRNATSDDDDVALVPAGYQTNPMFSTDEINIEEDKCNDPALQKLLVEGMRVDDSLGSKRSIGALLAAAEVNSVSVLCSEQNLAFRLVARKHCQLSSGKTTCVVFQL